MESEGGQRGNGRCLKIDSLSLLSQQSSDENVSQTKGKEYVSPTIYKNSNDEDVLDYFFVSSCAQVDARSA